MGPYREVAVLSGLVGRGQDLSIGAWASHIFVDSEEAAFYGRKHWGLPAEVVAIDFGDGVGEDRRSEVGNLSEISPDAMAAPSFLFEEDRITVRGWGCDENERSSGGWASWSRLVDVALPSFSGRLAVPSPSDSSDPLSGDSQPPLSPLLKYPLRIRRPESIKFGPAGKASCQWSENVISGDSSDGSEQKNVLREIIESPAMWAIDIGRVDLTAGIAEEIAV